MGLMVLAVQGQMVNPVHFSSQLNKLKGNEGEIVFSATINDGWHVYSTDLGSGGPISATFNVEKMEGVEAVGKLQPRGNVIKQYDKMFDMELRFFEKKAQFVQKVRFTKSHYAIDCYLEYGACNDEMCMPPTEVPFKEEGDFVQKKEEKAKEPDPLVKQEKVKETVVDTVAAITIPAGEDSTAIAGSEGQFSDPSLQGNFDQQNRPSDPLDHSLLYILLMGFVGGLLAVLMPCIWPIIPMTVSFFLKRAKSDRKKGLRDALIYGLSIVVIYLTLGLLVTFVRMSKAKVLQWIAKIYISIMRGTPLMLQLLVVFYGPHFLFGAETSQSYRFYAVIIGFSLNYAAYFAEIYRSGIESIPVGQREAADVLGYSKRQTFRKIIFPQMCKRVIPPVTNEVITLVKDTSLAFALAYTEMFTLAKQITASEASILPLFIAGIFYYIFNFVVAMFMEGIEKKMKFF